MTKGIRERLRGARKIEWFAAMTVIALLALMAVNGQAPPAMNKTDLELRLENVLSHVQDSGTVNIMINQSEEGEITGVLIVSDHGFSMKTQIEIINAVRTLLDIDLNRISIIENN